MDNKGKEIRKNIVKCSFKICSIVIAFFTSAYLWYWNISPYWDEGYFAYITLFMIGVMFCIVYWFFVKMYQAQKIGIYRLTDLAYFQLLSYCFTDIVLLVEMIFWFHGIERLRFWTFFVILFVQMSGIIGAIFVHNRIFMRFDEPRRTVVIYGNDHYRFLLKKMNAKKYRYNIRCCLHEETDMDVIKEKLESCDSVYLYEVNDEVRRKLILYCDSIGKDIYYTQDVEDWFSMGFDISHALDTPFIRTKRVPEKWYYGFVKRTIDLACSGLGLLLLAPVFLITALAIKLYDGGPVFYKQVRLTKNHKEFQIYKFRSMIVDAEKQGARLASQNDDRITPVGKIIRATRIDELPQLINILKGDMTIVGPRPERPEIEKVYLEELPEFGLRLKVKAGLTGYAQVYGKYNTTPEDKLKLDLLYINQRSVLLDFKLIFYTVKILFMPEATEGIDEGKTTAGK